MLDGEVNDEERDKNDADSDDTDSLIKWEGNYKAL